MDYVQLGTTGAQVSRIILGCGNFGGIGSSPAFFGQGETDDEAAAIMDAAFELGINVFDTADAYGGGRSESAIGRWLAAQGLGRARSGADLDEGLQPRRRRARTTTASRGATSSARSSASLGSASASSTSTSS